MNASKKNIERRTVTYSPAGIRRKTSFWSEQQDGERRWKQTWEFGLESQTERPFLFFN